MVHPHALDVLSIERALAGTWELRRYDEAQTIISRVELRFETNGNWSEVAGDVRVTGRWSVDEQIRLEERTRSGVDSDDTTVELIREGSALVSETYLDLHPWTRVEHDAARSRYTRAWTEVRGDSEASVAQTMTLALDGSYRLEHSVSGIVTEVREGTYRRDRALNYSESLGDFLVVEETRVNDVELDEPAVLVQLLVELDDRLLTDPYLRVRDDG